MNASDFASGDEFPFGLLDAAAATALRKFASDIERGLVLVNHVVVSSEAEKDEFTAKVLTITFVEKRAA